MCIWDDSIYFFIIRPTIKQVNYTASINISIKTKGFDSLLSLQLISVKALWTGETWVFPCSWLIEESVLDEMLPTTSLENKSRGIPQLQFHHIVIIANWQALMLNKWIKLYWGTEVISEYLLVEEVISFYKLVSYVLRNTYAATGLTQWTFMEIPSSRLLLSLLAIIYFTAYV